MGSDPGRQRMNAKHGENRESDWTAGAAKWAAVGVLGLASIVGMAWSIWAWERREDDRSIDAERRLDLNTASASELQLLPEVGPTLASRIVEYREWIGAFQSVDELDEVEGVGPRTIAGLRSFIVVGSGN